MSSPTERDPVYNNDGGVKGKRGRRVIGKPEGFLPLIYADKRRSEERKEKNLSLINTDNTDQEKAEPCRGFALIERRFSETKAAPGGKKNQIFYN